VTVTAPAVVLTAGGWPHGIRNPGEETARYVVFEFHGVSTMIDLTGHDPEQVAPLPDSTSPVPEPASTPPPLGRRARTAVWTAGGRVLGRFPRAKSFLRRALRHLSPWR
jgi:hypothetical protein